MNIKDTKDKIKNGGFNNSFNFLYGEAKNASVRFNESLNSFLEIFGDRDNIRLFSAPGRTEIGGNHTDHQHGAVIAGSVDLDVIAVVSANSDGIIRIKSEGYPMDTVDLREIDIKGNEKGRSSSLIRGVAAAFAKNGFKIGGFDAYTTSNVLKGSGLSSSAAFEVLVSNILNGLYNENKANTTQMAKFSQFSEREYFGKPCGLLDQMASATGGFVFVDFKNPSEPLVEKIEYDLEKSDYTLCVVDTGGNHANLTQDYADITIECKAVSNALSVEFLREANQDDFYKNIADLRNKCGDRAVLRAFHFYTEQERVFNQKSALNSGNFEEFLTCVNASGNSSYKYLQNIYSNSNVGEQALGVALALTEKFLNGKGACRVHGGGFAGTIQAYIPKNIFDEYKAMIEAVFGEGSCIQIKIRKIGGYELKD